MEDLQLLDQPPDVDLPQKHSFYVYWRSLGVPPTQAVKRAGLNRFHAEAISTASELEANPKIQAAILAQKQKNQTKYDIQRDDVVGGLLEAIDVAREQSDAKSMIAGWGEVAKVTGVSAPERKEIAVVELNDDSLRQASTAELLQLLEKRRQLPFYEIQDAELVP